MDKSIHLISRDEGSNLLKQIGLRLGDWNEIRIDGSGPPDWHSAQVEAPRDANEMLCLALHAAGWLPTGRWRLLQLDNSNHFTRVDRVLLSGLISNGPDLIDFNSPTVSTILFDLSGERADAENTHLILGHLLRALLACQGVSSPASDTAE